MVRDSVQTSTFVGGGYMVVRLAERGSRPPAALLPEWLFSASACVCPHVPDAWAIPWVQITETQRTTSAETFGIGPQGLPAVVDWVTRGLESGALGWPGVFLSLADARAFVRACLPSLEGLVLLGIGLHPTYAAPFLREGAPSGSAAKSWGYGSAPPGTPAFYAAVHQGLMLAPEGTALGFELLGYDGLASFHSWLCNSLVEIVYNDVHVRPNEFGLLGTLAEVEQGRASISRKGVGKEPGVWLPWLVKGYSFS